MTKLRMRSLRKEKGLTLYELGEKIGMSQSNLSELESGKNKLTAENAKKFAAFYGVSVDYLLGVTDSRMENIDIQLFTHHLSKTKTDLMKQISELTDEQAQKILDLLKTFGGNDNEK